MAQWSLFAKPRSGIYYLTFMRIVALVFSAGALFAQDHGVTPEIIQRGGQVYLTNCATCHGPDGDSVSGVNLASGRFRKARTDQDLIDIVRNGIPGTPMPPGNFSEPLAAAIIAYLHSMAATPRSLLKGTNPGDPVRGRSIFEGKGQCLNCHRIEGIGAFSGPDLSDIGATRRRADIETSIGDPNAEIRQDNRSVRAVLPDGAIITGNLLNQDTYSVQLLDPSGRLVSLSKAKLREFEILTISPMPSYKDKLSTQELSDLVAYLGTLRATR
jgi:putative heme-binding domain-containing protein